MMASPRCGVPLLAASLGIALAGCQPIDQAPSSSQQREIPPGMVLIEGGSFAMGSDHGREDEAPVHRVTVGDFAIDRHPVTNQEFAKFVKETQYKTTAELPPDPKAFPGADPALLVPGSLVFAKGEWSYVPGANWRHPEGPKSNLTGKENHPVVQVSWYDAVAYAKWAGKELPTEAEFEFAARCRTSDTTYTWGNEPLNEAHPQVNCWQGNFPEKNNNTDGYLGTSPVGSFAPNRLGLLDIAGNVWEWCADWYRPDYYAQSPPANPKGPEAGYDPDEPNIPKRVVRGGSFLCANCYCQGYRVSARMKTSPDTSLMHTGFRCVVRFK